MKLQTLFCAAVLMAAGAWQARAQTAASPTPRPTPPAPPFLNDTPDFSAWTITRYIVPGAGGQSADAVIRSAASASKPESVTSVRKTGQVRHQSRKLKTGEQEDVWYEQGDRITMQSIWRIPLFEGEVNGAKRPQGADFPELAWVAAGNFAGTQEGPGGTYFVFETQLAEGNAALAKAYKYQLKPSAYRVYINADTRLPWLLQTGDVLQRYTFQAAPTAMVEVPAEYQTMFDTYEKKKKEPARRPMAP